MGANRLAAPAGGLTDLGVSVREDKERRGTHHLVHGHRAVGKGDGAENCAHAVVPGRGSAHGRCLRGSSLRTQVFCSSSCSAPASAPSSVGMHAAARSAVSGLPVSGRLRHAVERSGFVCAVAVGHIGRMCRVCLPSWSRGPAVARSSLCAGGGHGYSGQLSEVDGALFSVKRR